MKRFFLLSLFLYAPCSAGYADWLYNRFLSKSHQAVIAYHKQDYEKSLADLGELMDRDPYNPEYNYNVGVVLYKEQKYADAQQAFLRAADHVQSPVQLQQQAHFNVGNCYYQLEQWQKAVDAYRQVLKIDAGNKQAEHNLQLALYKLKEQQMKDQSEQQKEQDQQQDNKSSDDQHDQSQQSKSCDGSKQDASQKNQSGQQQGDQEQSQNGNNKHDKKNDQGKQQDGDQGDAEQDGQESDSGNDSHDESGKQQRVGQNKSGSKKSVDDKMTEEEIADKNEQALQDLADKVDTAGKDGQEQQAQRKNQAGQQDLSDQLDQAENSDLAAMPDIAADGTDKKDMGGLYKKPDLKNQLQQQYEDKASDDERLTEYHASVMKTLEDLEEKIQKHVIKNKVAMQGAGQNGKKGW